ncbi:MAG: twin-arginine translocation signal domain-containing protein, partial [Pseudomonadota bacterium]
MISRRDFLQFGAVSASATALALGGVGSITRALAQQKLTQDDLLKFDSKGQVTLLHFTDVHAQLKPVYFRPPSENFGVGAYEGIPPHLVAGDFLSHFGVKPGTPLAYA